MSIMCDRQRRFRDRDLPVIEATLRKSGHHEVIKACLREAEIAQRLDL